MDEQQITIARNYLKGAAGQLLLDQLPLRSASQVLTIEDREDGKPVYVADSANTATSMATGEVTSRGRISTSAGSDRDLTTIVELAAAAGLRSGIVSTASVTDATPAAFAAHINFRLCENPQPWWTSPTGIFHWATAPQHLKANGGKGSISEQLANSTCMSCSAAAASTLRRRQRARLSACWNWPSATAFHGGLRANWKSAKPGKRLLGLFSKGTMPVRLQGEDGREAEAPNPAAQSPAPLPGDVKLPAPMTLRTQPGYAGVPSLQADDRRRPAHLSHNNDAAFS